MNENISNNTAIGELSHVVKGYALGWAVAPNQLDTRLVVEIINGDVIIAKGVANLEHKHLKEKKLS